MMKTLFTLMLITMMVATSTAQESCSNFQPTFSPDGSTLYFSSNRSGTFYIYRANANGSDVQRVSSNDFEEWAPQVSPDGSKIVFYTGSYGPDAEIYIMNSDGSGVVQLTNNNRYDGNPHFSPDGNKIVFDGWDEMDFPEIFIMNTDGTGRTQITNEAGAYWQSAPVYHPSGEKIYFLEGLNADNHIVMMNVDGSNWVNITDPNEFGYAEAGIDFNADGSRLVFMTSEWVGYNGPPDIVTCAADGSGWQRLTQAAEVDGRCYSPCYNRAAGKIIYGSDLLNDSWVFDLYSMDTDGANKTVIVTCRGEGIADLSENQNVLTCGPNPVISESVIRLELKSADNFDLRVYNNLGKRCSVEFSITNEGIRITKGNLVSGIYYFRIFEGPVNRGTGKFVVP